MELKNRQFKNNITNEIVKVIDSFENVVILDDRTKTSPLVILNPNLYTEIGTGVINESFDTFAPQKTLLSDEVDVNSFFGNQVAYNSLADKIKNIPAGQMGNEHNEGSIQVNVDMANQANANSFIPPSQENIVYEVSEEDEKQALARKYGIASPDVDSISKQNEAFKSLLGEDEDVLDIPQIFPQSVITDEAPVQRIEVSRESDEYAPIQKEVQTEKNEVEDPIIKMFKGVKRNLTFNMNIELSDKIPRVDFIEMMEDSYESSIIDFLANEFTEKILSDPERIRTLIKDKIKKMVYGEITKPETEEKVEVKATKEVKKKRVYKKKNEVSND